MNSSDKLMKSFRNSDDAESLKLLKKELQTLHKDVQIEYEQVLEELKSFEKSDTVSAKETFEHITQIKSGSTGKTKARSSSKRSARKKKSGVKPIARTRRVLPKNTKEVPVVEEKKMVEEEEVIESYALNAPYVFAKISTDPSRGNIRYFVQEPKLGDNDRANLNRLKELLKEVVKLKVSDLKSRKLAREYLLKKTHEVLDRYRFNLDDESKNKLLYYIVRDNLGLGKIDPLGHDQWIEDISCDGVGVPIYIWHRRYESIPTNVKFETADELDAFALRLAYLCGSHVSIAKPMLDATMPDGSRINLTYGSEITSRGSTFTIRKFRLDPFTVTDIVNFNTFSKEMAAYFWYAVENRVSILVAGGIAAGKTTALNCLSMFIKPDLKIVSIEETRELNLPHENWIPAFTRTSFGISTGTAEITLFDLLKASLRQRPDYIIVGEIRGAEAYTLFQAVSTGHLGMSTIHAESVEAAVYRLESAPMNIPRTLIAGVDIFLVMKRVEYDGKPARRVVTASEIVGLDPRSGEILTNEIFKWNSNTDTFEYTGRSYILEKIAEKKGISVEQANEEIQRRMALIDWLAKKNIRNYKDVSRMIRSYYQKPDAVLKEVFADE
jgi:flagellar protein FlaI